LWADDEIDLLKPQLFFLEKKGYEVATVTNGYDAVEEFQTKGDFDVVFLDESMPGMTGLETLSKIKELNANVPVVMITKNEAENLMEEAIGSQIDDYLIKPVNPNQILLTLKKIIDNKRLVSEKTVSSYQQEFRQILMDINSGLDYKEWVSIYRKLISWEIKMDFSNTQSLENILASQKSEANAAFSKYIVNEYPKWIKGDMSQRPMLSPDILREKVFPMVGKGTPTIVLLLDNLRYDQWKALEPIFLEHFKVEEEDYFYSILPTATQYSRNAIFAGMMPGEIARHYPDYWLHDHEEGGKNQFEKELLLTNVKRIIRNEIKVDYLKVTNINLAKQLEDNVLNYLNNDLTVVVYNFIDMLSHARTEMEVLKELVGDEKAYRSLTRSWFLHSSLWQALQKLIGKPVQLIVTTDHGTVRVKTPSKVIGDRDTTTNLRYKLGRNLQYDRSDVLEVRNPKELDLPQPHVSSSYIFATEDKYFLYPNNYNYYNNYYRDTFQHGGISLEEMVCPIVSLKNK
jgi:CheY-like chemotaxis protein